MPRAYHLANIFTLTDPLSLSLPLPFFFFITLKTIIASPAKKVSQCVHAINQAFRTWEREYNSKSGNWKDWVSASLNVTRLPLGQGKWSNRRKNIPKTNTCVIYFNVSNI